MATVKRTSASAASKEIVLEFVMDRETKNTYRFAEVDEDDNILSQADAKVGNLYIKKTEVDAGATSVTVTIKVNK